MKVSELIRGWIEYATDNGIRVNKIEGRDPTTSDIEKYLSDIGIATDVFKPIIGEVVKQVKNTDNTEQERTGYTDREIHHINQIKNVMKDKSDNHKMQLLRVLKYEQ